MAVKLNAVTAYAPRLSLGKTVQKEEMVELISLKTGLNRSEVSAVLEELSDTLVFFTRKGRGVKLEGLGTFLPSISLDGTIRVNPRLDNAIKNRLNTPGYFIGDIINAESIGQSMDALIVRWNADHPDDPIIL